MIIYGMKAGKTILRNAFFNGRHTLLEFLIRSYLKGIVLFIWLRWQMRKLGPRNVVKSVQSSTCVGRNVLSAFWASLYVYSIFSWKCLEMPDSNHTLYLTSSARWSLFLEISVKTFKPISYQGTGYFLVVSPWALYSQLWTPFLSCMTGSCPGCLVPKSVFVEGFVQASCPPSPVLLPLCQGLEGF